jgi:hypothetical protein
MQITFYLNANEAARVRAQGPGFLRSLVQGWLLTADADKPDVRIPEPAKPRIRVSKAPTDTSIRTTRVHDARCTCGMCKPAKA